jgi:hypothetical protein
MDFGGVALGLEAPTEGVVLDIGLDMVMTGILKSDTGEGDISEVDRRRRLEREYAAIPELPCKRLLGLASKQRC